MTLDPQARRVQAIRKAMQQPDQYLAAALGELDDDTLAARVGMPASSCWKLRLQGWPRDDCWARDVTAMAEAVSADPQRLARLLVEVGIRA